MFGFAIICRIENNLLIMKILSPVYWTYYVVCFKQGRSQDFEKGEANVT